jgi:PadR family transcriptional regulator
MVEGLDRWLSRLDINFSETYNVVSMADILGAFEQAVRLGDEAYGRAVLKEVQARLDREVAAGAVHATLDRLENKGLVASRLGSGTPIRSGRPRRFYRLRPKGVRALNDARAAVEGLWRGLKWPLEGNA